MIVTPVFIRQSMPDKPERGYGDIARVYHDDEIVFECEASTCPNPYTPKGKTRWQDAYTMVCCGVYSYTSTFRKQWGRCLAVNGGLDVPAVLPNNKHNGRCVAKGIFVHRGGSGSSDGLWRGSAGCMTIAPASVDAYFAYFPDGLTGAVVITDDKNYTMDKGGLVWVNP